MEIIKARFHSLKELEEAYQTAGGRPHVGKLFVPTTTEFQPNEAVIVELVCDGLPNRILMRGTIESWRPALPRLRVRAGATVTFSADEADKWGFVIAMLQGKVPTTKKRKHTRIPIEVAVHYRQPGSTEAYDGVLTELSMGGALLKAPCPEFEKEIELLLQIVAPGSEATMDITGKVAYQTKAGLGLRFIYRDGGGSRRLREWIRRIKVS